MTRTERFCWTIGIVGFLGMLIGTSLMARAQDRVPVEATDWKRLYAAPQSVDLASIKPLSIVHYSWPLRAQDISPTPAWWVHDFVRITKAATIHADMGTTEAHVRAVCRIAAQYKASVGIVMAPYHHASWPTIPGTQTADPRITDATYWPWWSARLTTMKGWIESEGCSVGMVIYDCERFVLKPASEKGSAEWNAAARVRYDEAYDAAKSIFGPACYVEWYSRGWWRPIGTTRLQRYAGPYHHFDLTEKGDGVSCVVTRPDWTDAAIGSVYETAQRSPGVADPLVVWLYIGVGYKYDAGTLSYSGDWDYGVDGARGLRKVRENFPDRLRAGIFYPSPGATPHGLSHFAEYARGLR